MRRAQSKQSSIDARDAMDSQLEGNRIVAAIIREQAEVIKKQKIIDAEIQTLQNQEIVEKVKAVEIVAPAIAVDKVTYSERNTR
jgi:hypothetical protein